MSNEHQNKDPLASWLSKDEAAQLLRRTVRTLDRMIRDGEIVAVKYGHQVMVPRTSIEDYVAKLEAKAKKEAAARARANRVPA